MTVFTWLLTWPDLPCKRDSPLSGTCWLNKGEEKKEDSIVYMKEWQGPPRSVQKHNLNSLILQSDSVCLSVFSKETENSDCRHMMQLFSSCYQVKISKTKEKSSPWTSQSFCLDYNFRYRKRAGKRGHCCEKWNEDFLDMSFALTVPTKRQHLTFTILWAVSIFHAESVWT